ncbi:MAG: hypothetical protein ACOY5F_14385 [Pseudomonadota bacterium]
MTDRTPAIADIDRCIATIENSTKRWSGNADYRRFLETELFCLREVKARLTADDWREDPSADERWQAGCDFAMVHLCKALDVDPQAVRWDAATETLDGDVIAVIWNILRAKMGEDWDPGTAARPRNFLAWAVQMFGSVAMLRFERLMRFVEEAIELAHAEGMSSGALESIVNRVYTRPAGETLREIGQAQACLETFAENIGASSAALAEAEWQRVQRIPAEEWQRRHKAKQEIGIAMPDPSTERP